VSESVYAARLTGLEHDLRRTRRARGGRAPTHHRHDCQCELRHGCDDSRITRSLQGRSIRAENELHLTSEIGVGVCNFLGANKFHKNLDIACTLL